MLRLLTSILAALLVGAAPAVADPETTGGLPAAEPPVLSPQGGVHVSGSAPPATAAQTGDEAPGTDEPTETPPIDTAPEPQTEGDSTLDLPAGDPAPDTEPAATTAAPSSGTGGGGLPHTGFALAALLAIGVCFVLTGYTLRYSRALDG